MRRVSLALTALLLLSLVAASSLPLSAVESPTHLMIVEWYDSGSVKLNAIPAKDNSNETRDYKLLPFYWHTTAEYYINPKNKYGFSTDAVVSAITAAANTWDSQTKADVFSYKGITSRSAGKRDGYNVIDWGPYRAGVIAVTYIWYVNDTIIETDTRMNSLYKWSLSGEAEKMDVQNIMTHEFGHWCGLDDLYDDKDYWLTMYGYAGYGETYKRTLGLGDVLGLQERYGGYGE